MTLDEKISSFGFRLTAPRKKILSILARQNHPLCYEEYATIDPDTDKSTFYRTMQTFESASIISGIESDAGKRYFELNETLHPHFICQSCSTITCLDPAEEPRLEGYRIESVIYKGVCPACSAF